MKLKGKVVLITGSATGIGKETAAAFAEKGAKVIITKHKRDAKSAVNQCSENCSLFSLDVTDDKSIKKLVSAIKKKYGQLDILVNNAAVIHWKPFEKHSMKDIEKEITTNLIGVAKITSAFIPLLKKPKEAMIINIASGGGKEPFAGAAVYCSTKFGVRGFTKALALELPKKIKIFSVNPGMTATKMTNYQGVDPSKVAQIIVKTAEEKLRKKSGDDVDIWKYV